MTALGGRAPAGALVFACNGRGRSMFGRADHDAEAVADALAGAPAAGFFAAGEIGPVGGEYFLHSFTATVAVFAADEALTRRVARVLLTGATGGLGQAIARGAGRARGVADADGPARRSARAARARDRRPRDRLRPLRARRARAARSRRRARSTCWSRTPALPGSGRLDSLHARGDRPCARRQPARADAARPRPDRADGRARQRAPAVHVLALGPGRRARARRSTRPRSSGCAASPWPCARTSCRRASASPWSSRASSATPACSPSRAPSSRRGVGTKRARGRRPRGRESDRVQPRRARRRPARRCARARRSPRSLPGPAGAVQRRFGAAVDRGAQFGRGQASKR